MELVVGYGGGGLRWWFRGAVPHTHGGKRGATQYYSPSTTPSTTPLVLLLVLNGNTTPAWHVLQSVQSVPTSQWSGSSHSMSFEYRQESSTDSAGIPVKAWFHVEIHAHPAFVLVLLP